MSYQLPLFTGIQRPICPACKRECAILGQWAPGSRLYVCQTCMSVYAPPNVFIANGNSIGVGLRQEAFYAPEREQYHRRSQALEELAKGCIYTVDDIDPDDYLPCMRENDLWMMVEYHVSPLAMRRPIYVDQRLGCPRCKNRLRYVMQQRQQVITFKDRMKSTLHQTSSLPICARCGAVHDHKTLSGDAAPYCQPCEDLNAVESLWKNKGIFGGDDDETTLDRLERAFPQLFERGVLPDQWFRLKLEAGKKPGS